MECQGKEIRKEKRFAKAEGNKGNEGVRGPRGPGAYLRFSLFILFPTPHLFSYTNQSGLDFTRTTKQQLIRRHSPCTSFQVTKTV